MNISDIKQWKLLFPSAVKMVEGLCQEAELSAHLSNNQPQTALSIQQKKAAYSLWSPERNVRKKQTAASDETESPAGTWRFTQLEETSQSLKQEDEWTHEPCPSVVPRNSQTSQLSSGHECVLNAAFKVQSGVWNSQLSDYNYDTPVRVKMHAVHPSLRILDKHHKFYSKFLIWAEGHAGLTLDFSVFKGFF